MNNPYEGSSKLIWEADSTHPKESEKLREELREVIDPEIGLNIIELGLVRDVHMDDQRVDVNMILTTPFCPYGPAMIDMTRRQAENALNRPVRIEMGVEMWDPSMMEEGAASDWGLF